MPFAEFIDLKGTFLSSGRRSLALKLLLHHMLDQEAQAKNAAWHKMLLSRFVKPSRSSIFLRVILHNKGNKQLQLKCIFHYLNYFFIIM